MTVAILGDRAPTPHDLAAEEAVLGAMLVSPTAITHAADALQGADFNTLAHELIYVALTDQHQAGHPTDPIAIADVLARRSAGRGDQLKSVGGLLYLHHLIENACLPANVTHHARIVRNHATTRRLADAALRIQQLAASNDDPPALLEQAQAALDRVAAGITHNTNMLAKYPALDLAELLRPDRPERDYVMEGLLPAGAAISIVSPAGTGKSLLALALGLHLARGRRSFAGLPIPRARRVLYVDMENTVDDLAERYPALGFGRSDTLDMFHHLSFPMLPPLDTAAGGRELMAIVHAYGLTRHDVVILDSFQRVTAGDENESDTLRAYYLHTGVQLKRAELTVIRLDNTGKDTAKGSRGTSGKRDDVDVEFVMLKDAEDPTKFHIRVEKTRLSGIEPITITRQTDADGRILFSAAEDPRRAAIVACKEFLAECGMEPTVTQREAEQAVRASGRKFNRVTIRAALAEWKRSRAGGQVALLAQDSSPDAVWGESGSDYGKRCADNSWRKDGGIVAPFDSGAERRKASESASNHDSTRGNVAPNPGGARTATATIGSAPSAAISLEMAQAQAPAAKKNEKYPRCAGCNQPMAAGDGQPTHPGCAPTTQEDGR